MKGTEIINKMVIIDREGKANSKKRRETMAERKKLLAGIGCREGSAVLLNRVEEISNRSLNALAHYLEGYFFL